MRGVILLGLLLSLAGCAGLSGTGDLLEQQSNAAAAYAAGDYATASRHYRALCDRLPQDAELRYRLGNALAKQGDAEAAIQAYREALVRDPKHAKAWHNLIHLQLQGVAHTVTQMYLQVDRNDPRVEPLAAKAEAVMRAFEVPLERREP